MLEMPASTYQKYEDRYQKPYLPLAMAAKLVNALRAKGIAPEEVWSLAAADQVESFLEAWASRSDSATAQPAVPVEREWHSGNGGRRSYERWTPLPAELALDGERHACVVKDISPAGACVLAEAAEKLKEAAEVLLQLSEFGQVPAQVTHRAGNELGLSFGGNAQSMREMADWLAPMRSVRH
jgi:hypothetical protein